MAEQDTITVSEYIAEQERLEKTPHNDDFDDFLCRTCTRAHPFLRRYAQHSLFMIGLSEKGGDPKSVTMVDCSKGKEMDLKGKEVRREDATDKNIEKKDTDIDIVTTDTTTHAEGDSKNTIATTTIATTIIKTDQPESSEQTSPVTTTISQMKRSLETTGASEADRTESTAKKIKLTEEGTPCKLNQQPVDAYPDQEMNLFATEGWRDLLCQCTRCTAMYTEENVSFILGEEAIYEDEEDDEADTSILESGMKKLSEMDRVQVMDGMLAYSKMRDEIRNFLKPFSEQGKVVTSDDIQAFFTAKMEQRATLGGKPNYF
ncbi:putative E3 ubiquitin-protein ligase ubr7 [Mortierella sp. GBA30]|nr:putative E3 ubiquitin-protein ligase ubr7 [Mortierella sp. GBA30]